MGGKYLMWVSDNFFERKLHSGIQNKSIWKFRLGFLNLDYQVNFSKLIQRVKHVHSDYFS